MNKPLIGINLDIKNVERDTVPHASIASTYYDAVTMAGGIPVLIPPMPDSALKRLLDRLDGVMLIGGNDYSPWLYGEPAHEKLKPLHPVRQEFDLRLARLALRRPDLAVLGICGGCQLLNLAMGGSLLQDIPSELPDLLVKHHREKDEIPRHDVLLARGSRLRSIYRRKNISVVTSHHQAVRQPGHGFIIVAHAADGIAEAIEMPSRKFALGVQWHPERDFEGSKRLFRAFVRSAAQ